jgi:hypothetical protein
MKSFNIVALSLVGTSLLFISGCAKYQARPLSRLVIPLNPQNQEQTVTLAYRVFSKRDCLHYLDRDIIAKGYQPVHITIANNTNHAYNVCLDSFSIPCTDYQIVAQRVHTSTATRAASYGVGALFFFPLIIPAVVDGVGSSQANQQLDADFEHKSLTDQIINPFTTVSGLIFVPTKDFTRNFTISLADASNNERLVLASNNFCTKA